jgi:hypothetical protein
VNSKKRSKDKLPRGLWVGLIIKPRKLWTDPNTPEYFENFYYRIRKKGLFKDQDAQQRAMPDYIRTLSEAREYGRLQFQAAELRATQALQDSVHQAHARRGKAVTVGQYLTAFTQVAARRRLKQAQRAISSLRLVIATGKGKITPGAQRMDREGGRLIQEVDALTLRDAVCKDTALEYARILQGGPHLNIDKNNPPDINNTINSTLAQARICFSTDNRIFEVEELQVPWDIISGFLKFTVPSAGRDIASDIPSPEAFGKMMTAWQADATSGDPLREERALVNEMFRLLGLRSGELVMARESWLVTGSDGRTFLWVKNYPAEGWSCKGKEQAKLPLTDALAARLRARCQAARAQGIHNPHLIFPHIPGQPVNPKDGAALETTERRTLIRTEHNTWLKTFIGEVKSNQGNHRLRKYCATRIYHEEMAAHGNEHRATARVKEYLRHAKEATALIHYIAKNDERLATVTDATLMPAPTQAAA